MSTEIESLELKITSNSKSAVDGIDALVVSLGKLEKATKGFSSFSTGMGNVSRATDRASTVNAKASSSFTDLYHKVKVSADLFMRLGDKLWSAIDKSNEYTENMNLFSVAMGEYASSAMEYAETVSDAMGIDTSEWIRAQGVFMTMSTGFGVASDRAAIMSKNLTQLGYDLASFYNLSTDDAMKKLKSGLAGELEPLRAIGYDLSQAKLEATALELGIDKAVSSMTQAEKAQLRYYAIMTQVTVAQGDMARTLDDPANQLRVLRSQFNMAAREIGNIFIPALNAILPYIIAITKVVRSLANIIAGLVGYEMPEVDYSGVNSMSNSATDTSDAMENATESAKKLKSYMLGFDELNVINPNEGSEVDNLLGGLDFELPEYNFLDGLVDSKVDAIVSDMKEWLGITEDIDSWAELFETRLGKILIVVGLIGGALALWKIANGVVTAFNTIGTLFGKKGIGNIGVGNAGSNIASPKTVLKGLANVGIIVGGVIALVVAIGILTKIPGFKETMQDGLSAVGTLFENLLPAIIPITLVSVAMITLGKVKVSQSAKGLANAAIIVGGTVGLVTAIGALISIPYFNDFLSVGTDSLQEVFNGLYEISIPIGLLSGAIIGLGFATPAIILKGLAGFALIIGGLTAVMVALGALAQIDGFQWIVEEGGNLLANLGNILGKFVGSIVGGFAEGVTDSFPAIGQHLGDFMKNAEPFFDGLHKINKDSVASLGHLVKMVLAITAVDVLDGLTSWITGGNSLVKFGEDLKEFAPNFVAYAEAVKGVDTSVVEATSIAAQSIVEFSNNVPNEGGIVSWFTGDNNIDVFGEKLPRFGKSLKEYSDSVKGLDANVVTNSAKAAEAIVKIAKDAPNEGGIVSWFTGDNNIDTWGEKLPRFGKSFKEYSDSIAGLDGDAVANSAKAAAAMVELARNAPNEGGIVSWFTGDNNIDTWGEKLPRFGRSFKEYSDSIAGLDINAVANSVEAAGSIVALSRNAPNEGGIVSWFTGENNIDTWAKKLPDFGDSLKEYGDSIADLDVASVANSVKAAESIVALSGNAPNEGGIISWFTGENNIDTWGEKLPGFGKSLKEYGDSVKGLDSSIVKNTAAAAESMVVLCAQIPNSGGIKSWFVGDNDIGVFGQKLASFGLSFKVYYETIKGMSKTVLQNITNCIGGIIDFAVRIKNEVELNKLDDFTDAIKDLGKAIKDLPTSKTITITVNQVNNGDAIGAASGVIGSIPMFAKGGFPEQGQMFVAREAGAEMVGSIGRRTAVANNDQIVAGIAGGVAEANGEQNALLREQNSLLRAILEKDSGVYLDGKNLTNSVEKYQRERGRVLITGGVV